MDSILRLVIAVMKSLPAGISQFFGKSRANIAFPYYDFHILNWLQLHLAIACNGPVIAIW
jgi:hypothetical protein